VARRQRASNTLVGDKGCLPVNKQKIGSKMLQTNKSDSPLIFAALAADEQLKTFRAHVKLITCQMGRMSNLAPLLLLTHARTASV